jgi:tetratricopeptide (TPR) repeat protein
MNTSKYCGLLLAAFLICPPATAPAAEPPPAAPAETPRAAAAADPDAVPNREPAATAEAASTPAAPPPAPPTVPLEQFEALLKQLELQQSTALQAIEQVRHEAEAAARRNDEAIAAKLLLIEQALAAQREREVESLRSSNRFTLIIIGVFAGIVMLGMLVIADFLLRAVNRVAEAATAFPAAHGLVPAAGAATAALGPLTTDESARQISGRFLSVIERLERRVNELEGAAGHRRLAPAGNGAAGHAEPAGLDARPGTETAPTAEAALPAEKSARISMLLSKGQSLLNHDQAEDALACFEEVLALEAGHADALVKRGKALEKMRRLQDALESYDRALALDKNLTIAYLGKGAVFNRMERYTEALECYEMALRTQPQPRAA